MLTGKCAYRTERKESNCEKRQARGAWRRRGNACAPGTARGGRGGCGASLARCRAQCCHHAVPQQRHEAACCTLLGLPPGPLSASPRARLAAAGEAVEGVVVAFDIVGDYGPHSFALVRVIINMTLPSKSRCGAGGRGQGEATVSRVGSGDAAARHAQHAHATSPPSFPPLLTITGLGCCALGMCRTCLNRTLLFMNCERGVGRRGWVSGETRGHVLLVSHP